MKIQDILNIDTEQLRTMDIKQLQKIVRQAQRASERRLSAIEEKGLTLVSPAYESWNAKLRDSGLNETKKNRLRLISDLRKNQMFLNTETSLVKGARKFRKRMQKILPNVQEKDYKQFWNAVDAIRNRDEIKYMQLSSGAVINFLQAAWDASKTREQTNKEFQEIFNEEYRKSNERLRGKGRPDPDKYRGKI